VFAALAIGGLVVSTIFLKVAIAASIAIGDIADWMLSRQKECGISVIC